MKEIELTKGFYAIVDDDDFDELSKYNWSAGTGGYARRREWKSDFEKRSEKYFKHLAKHVMMHRYIIQEIMNLEIPKGSIVDHINGNRLDNRKENLRVILASDNLKNLGNSELRKKNI